jgi:hypothetical protein
VGVVHALIAACGDCSTFLFDPAMARRYHHNFYVVALFLDVLYEPRFRRATPDYITGKPCVYAGMTGLTPDVRFDKHKAGIQADRFAQEYGLRLMPELYAVYHPMPAGGEMEVKLAIAPPEAGYGLWQA